MQHFVTTYTTAPADYDWFGTEFVKVAGTDARGKEIREVKSPVERVSDQRARYMSGCHMAVDVAEWTKLVRYKLVTKASRARKISSPAP